MRRPVRQLFLFIGADPNTDWLSASEVALDARGFVRTGGEVDKGDSPLETSVPGIFAIGDVRAGSVKRVASAVGEGAQVIAAVHGYLAQATSGSMELRIASDDLRQIERRVRRGQRAAVWLSLGASLGIATALLAVHAEAPRWFGLPATAWGCLAGACLAFALAARSR